MNENGKYEKHKPAYREIDDKRNGNTAENIPAVKDENALQREQKNGKRQTEKERVNAQIGKEAAEARTRKRAVTGKRIDVITNYVFRQIEELHIFRQNYPEYQSHDITNAESDGKKNVLFYAIDIVFYYKRHKKSPLITYGDFP